MTLKELLETNGSIGELWVTIRDGKGFFIDEVAIGSHVREDKFANDHTAPRWKVIRKPINRKETGSDYWGVMLSVIPKELLDKQVTIWRQADYGFALNNGCWKFNTLRVDILGIDEYIEAKATEEPDQLEGQMSIEDFLGGDADEQSE